MVTLPGDGVNNSTAKLIQSLVWFNFYKQSVRVLKNFGRDDLSIGIYKSYKKVQAKEDSVNNSNRKLDCKNI